MKTIIICSGLIKDYEFFSAIIKDSNYIICADGGSRHAFKMKIKPDIIIGDLDSISKEYINYYNSIDVRIIKFPCDKDKTDTQLCIEYAMHFSDEIILIGATGNRIDHMLANISLLKIGIDRGKSIRMIDENNEIYLIDNDLTIKGQRGELISLLPISERVEGLTIVGSYYELIKASMEIGNPYGVSNYFLANEINISIEKGYLLVIKSRD